MPSHGSPFRGAPHLCGLTSLFLLLAACSTPPTQQPPQNPSLTVGGNVPVMPLDHPPVPPVPAGPSSAGTRRLTVRQLRASLPVVLGGATWQIGNANGFDTRAATLGEPDYVSVVDENLEPSPLYLKFMSDMARDACNRGLATGVMKLAGPTDTVASNKAAIDANLRYLKLAFHGVKVADADDAPIAALRTLFGAGATPTEGWRAVCVALLTAPEYHLY